MFSKKKSVGIFFGPNGVSIVETTGKGKPKNYIFSPYPKDIPKPSGAAAPKDNIFNVFLDSEEEIVAFLSKALRESRIDADNSEIVVCVPNRDLIVRFFELPPIPNKEVSSSIGFEIKKYIPFKIEDIVYDFQTHSKKSIIEVLFAGIKKEELDKYTNILEKLKVDVLAIEPAQFSLLRLLMLEKVITAKEAVVVVELEKGEGAISIIDNATPCFSRDIKIAGANEDIQADIETLSFRLVNEVRVSIDYFRRQYLKKGIDKIIILSKQESKELIGNFNKELGIAVQYKNTDEIFGNKEEHSLNLAKAMGASFRVHKPLSLTINLSKKHKPAAAGVFASPQQMISEAFEEIMDIPRPVIISGLVIAGVVLLGIFLWGNYRLKPIEQKLAEAVNQANAQLTGDMKGLDADRLSSFKKKLKSDLDIYNNVFKKDLFVSEKLRVLPELLPQGVWIERASFNRNNNNLVLNGVAFLVNEKEASDAPYSFVSNLKASPLFLEKVSSISVIGVRSAMYKEYKVTKFDIEVRFIN